MTGQEYKKIISEEFSSKNILVIGDLMVDEYVTGDVERISPEAPVPVLKYKDRAFEAGGACNVAHNVKALGANVAVAGVADLDEAGNWLRDHFKKKGISTDCVINESNRPTVLKIRFAVKGQQLMRMDRETCEGINEETQNKIQKYLEENIGTIDAVILSDYKKGVFENNDFVRNIISVCNKNSVPISVDSKRRDITVFENADIVKPNNLELQDAVGIRITDEVSYDEAGKVYLNRCRAKQLVVTRGKKGISVFEHGKPRKDYPAKDVQVYDVCGAGDTVISTVTLGVCSNMSLDESVKLANIAAGVVIGRVGTTAISAADLLEQIHEKQDS